MEGLEVVETENTIESSDSKSGSAININAYIPYSTAKKHINKVINLHISKS